MPRHHGFPRRRIMNPPTAVGIALIAAIGLASCGGQQDRPGQPVGEPLILLNVSYEPTRELYWEINQAFSRYWEEQTGQRVVIRMSHGGSASQARAVINGLQADVVTLALAHDIDAIAARTDLLAADWQTRLPNTSVPYTSTVTFLVRKGNPKQIRDWDDLVRPGVRVVTPNPKTSGVARLNYLAMWGHALRRELGPDFATVLRDPAQAAAVQAAQEKARAFVAAVYSNAPTLDWASRCATNSFVKSCIGDVLINWENENLLSKHGIDEHGLEIVVPSFSILAEPVVAIVDAVVDHRGTRAVAEAYVAFIYSAEGQSLVGRHFYRPAVCAEAMQEYRPQFPQLELFTIADVFGDWDQVSRRHFADSGIFDKLYPHDRGRRADDCAEF